MDTIRRSPRVRAGALAVLALLVTMVLGVRLQWAFDTDRYRAAAAQIIDPPTHEIASEIVTYPLHVPQQLSFAQGTLASTDAHDAAGRDGQGSGTPPPSGELRYRLDHWLSVVSLHDLPKLAEGERYLVFLRSMSGWVLAGAATPDADGEAQVRFGADPQPEHVFEVLVTSDVDDADSVPHGTPVLHWINDEAIDMGVHPWLPLLRRS
jgi:hypothetical protein